MLVETDWLIAGASARGKAHLDAGLPNQDHWAAVSSPDGRIVAAVVSDGAGTAKHAEAGSRATVEWMAPWLLRMGERISAGQLHPAMVRDNLMQGVLELRRQLDPGGGSLRNYHCTLVGCLLTPSGGLVCQIGDSIALTTRFTLLGDGPDARVDFFPDDGCHRYEVERGEYANETHFVTETDWTEHLRITALPEDFDAIVLMTDGAMDVVTLRGKVFRGFMSSLVGALLRIGDRSEREALIHSWLADRQTHAVTGDDKTLCVAIRARSRGLSGHPILLESQDQPTSPDVTAGIAVETSNPQALAVAPPAEPGARALPAGHTVPATRMAPAAPSPSAAGTAPALNRGHGQFRLNRAFAIGALVAVVAVGIAILVAVWQGCIGTAKVAPPPPSPIPPTTQRSGGSLDPAPDKGARLPVVPDQPATTAPTPPTPPEADRDPPAPAKSVAGPRDPVVNGSGRPAATKPVAPQPVGTERKRPALTPAPSRIQAPEGAPVRTPPTEEPPKPPAATKPASAPPASTAPAEAPPPVPAAAAVHPSTPGNADAPRAAPPARSDVEH